MREKVFLIIPALNEEKRLADVLQKVTKEGYQAVVVDDGSTDKTFEIASSFPVFALRHKLNRGQGAALETGMKFALARGAEIIVHFDGDGQFLTEEIEESIEPLLTGKTEVVLGSRYLKENTDLPWLKKYFFHPTARLVNFALTGMILSDGHCGFRAFTREAAEKIEIKQDDMSHATEIMVEIKKNKLNYKEVPITVIYHHFGRSFKDGFKIIKDLFVSNLLN